MAERNTLLIVDDFEFNRLMLCDTFNDRSVIEAENGQRAIEEFERHKDELCAILLDIMMPVMDGITALSTLRKTSNIPVILLTAKSQDFDKVSGLNAGADDYIAKPFGTMELISRIKALLRRSKISEEQLFYCNQRGIPTEQAVGLIVNGYAKEVLNKLPMEFAVEAQKLLSVSLEGTVG